MKTIARKNTRVAAGIALAMGIAAAGGTAHAAVIYNSAPGISFSGGGQNPIPIDGVSDPTFYATLFAGFPGIIVPPFIFLPPSSSYAQIDARNANRIAAANVGDDIGSSFPTVNKQGVYLPNGISYYGISFANGANTNYGWLKVTAANLGLPAPNPSFNVNSYAYDNTGAAIKVGATAAVPEPSSLVLLALGVGSLLTCRRRKSAA